MWNSVTECCLRIANHFSRRKSVLYVCEGMSSTVMGEAALARDRATRFHSVQRDITLGLPYQVSRPDGEEPRGSCRHFTTSTHEQDPEIVRKYIKPPANKTLFDLQIDGPHRSCSVGVFPSPTECGAPHHHRHSAPLDTHTRTQHLTSTSSSSSSSSSSSLPGGGWGCGEDGHGSPRRGRKGGHRSPSMSNYISSPFGTAKYEQAPQSLQPQQEWRRGCGTGPGEGVGPGCQDPTLAYCPATSTLADITTMAVPCGPSAHDPAPGERLGRAGGQGGLSHYRQLLESAACGAPADSPPPVHSDASENTNLYPSRPSEPRTKSGKI